LKGGRSARNARARRRYYASRNGVRRRNDRWGNRETERETATVITAKAHVTSLRVRLDSGKAWVRKVRHGKRIK